MSHYEFCYLFEKLKMFSFQLNSINNGPVLLFKTIFMHLNCFLLSVVTDGKDGQRSKIEKVGPTFSRPNALRAKITKKYYG